MNPGKYVTLSLLLFLLTAAILNVGFRFPTDFQPQTEGETARPQEPPYQLDVAPGRGGADGGEDGENGQDGDSSTEPVDVIRNGGFEARDPDPMVGTALEWEAYSNGQAHFGWYDETWPEAVHEGEHAQLMEIFRVDGNILDRTIAIYQTVNVVPNARYDLTLHALMRSDAPEPLRNQDEYEMSWGVDYFGEANYENVEEWVHMPLTEQLRLGSHGEVPDNEPLFYEVITGTVQTQASNRLTLFIRAVKKFPTGTEVNFDVDTVSLVGPIGTNVVVQPEPDDDDAANLPVSGSALPRNLSLGALLLGGLILVVLGVGATANLLLRADKS